MSLRLASAWRFRLAFDASLPPGGTYDWQYRNDDMRVTKDGLPLVSTDGRREMRLRGRLYQGGPVRFLGDVAWLRSDGEGFTFERGLWCGASNGDFDGVRIQVDGSPGERYRVRTDESKWRVNLRTHVRIEALDACADADRMVALLAYFWTDARSRHGSAG
jgi:hypothetical protein